MMTVNLGGHDIELEGVIFRQVPACSLRPGNGQFGDIDFEALPEEDKATLIGLVHRHIEAVIIEDEEQPALSGLVFSE